jgi:hypothetical protein
MTNPPITTEQMASALANETESQAQARRTPFVGFLGHPDHATARIMELEADLAEALSLLCSINDYEGDVSRAEFPARLAALLARHPEAQP